jgi:hypothetical protein
VNTVMNLRVILKAGNFLAAEQLSTSQEGVCSMQLLLLFWAGERCTDCVGKWIY